MMTFQEVMAEKTAIQEKENTPPDGFHEALSNAIVQTFDTKKGLAMIPTGLLADEVDRVTGVRLSAINESYRLVTWIDSIRPQDFGWDWGYDTSNLIVTRMFFKEKK